METQKYNKDNNTNNVEYTIKNCADEFNKFISFISNNKIIFTKQIKNNINTLISLWKKKNISINIIIEKRNKIHPPINKFINGITNTELKNIWCNYINIVDMYITHSNNVTKIENCRNKFINNIIKNGDLEYDGYIDKNDIPQKELDKLQEKNIGDEISVEYHAFTFKDSGITTIIQHRIRDNNKYDITENDKINNDGYTTYEIDLMKKKISNLKYLDMKKFNIKGNLEINDILDLLKNQDGKCYVCNEKVIINSNDFCCYQYSIDRIDNCNPHDSDNILISCYYCNCRIHKDFGQKDKICNSGCHKEKKDYLPIKSDLIVKTAAKHFNKKYICDDDE